MRKVITYFIKYPVAVNIIVLAFVLFGVRGLFSLKSSYFPLEDSTLITISITFPGASPAEMEEGVVLKIEDNLRGLIGIDRVTSISSENAAVITVEIFEDFNIDEVLDNVKNAVDRVPFFPVGMEPPVISKVEIINPAIIMALSGKGVSLTTLKQIARDIEDDLRNIDGISQIELTGFPDEEIEIAVREQDLRAYDLTFQEVAQAVSNTNIITTGGNIKTDTEDYLIRANNRAYYGNELDYVVVRASNNGNTIYLKDVATVRDKWSETPDRLFFDKDKAIQITVSSTNSEDLLATAENTRQYIEKFNQQNTNVQLHNTLDFSVSLNDRTELLVENGLIGIALVLVFLSIFLKPSIAFWVAFGLPIAFFGLFMVGPSFMTINVISLFGMLLVIGILVDDGIVISENIYNHYERGKNPIRAAIDGTVEVIPPIISAIVTTMVAFSTFFFITGRIGSFFGEIGLVVIIILAFSLIEALLILPAHLAHSRALKGSKKGFVINRWADQFIQWLRDKLYAPVLRFFLRYKVFGLAIPIAFLIVTIGALAGGIIKVTFFPPISSDQINIKLNMPQGTNEMITDSIITLVQDKAWEANKELSQQVGSEKLLIKNTVKRIGPGTASATLTLNLLPSEERSLIASEISNAVREKVGPLYGIENIEYGSGNAFGGKPVSVSLNSNNIQEIKAAKAELKRQLEAMPQLKDITDSDPAGIKEIKLKLKENAYLLGLTLNGVMSQVRSGFFGNSVQRIQRGQDEVRVWVRYDKKQRESIKNLDDMWIVTGDRSRVPLSEIAEYSIERGEVAINHLNGQREIRVEANLKNQKESASDLIASIRQNIMPAIIARYPTVEPLYEGQNREAGKIGASFQAIIPAILFLIYAIIAFTFRSYSQPLVLFAMIPFSLVGVAWGHYIHDLPVNMLSLLGIVALVGILVNDGLVLIGKFNSLLKEGYTLQDALFEAGKSRFRAIFLTSLTTIAGLAPLIFEQSFSAQFLIPMAISVAYGIFAATYLTLFMLPLLISLVNYVKVGRKWLWTGKKPQREQVERAIIEQKSERDALVELEE
ncbi:MAG: efflux RND transporter permease subunit [Bacteroidota bacterium]